jgi:DNA-directed RNA polymerase specialized sigma54-like protein
VVIVALLDDLETVKKTTSECAVQRILKQLPAKESQALDKAINDTENSATSLSKILIQNGIDISRHTIARHRKRGIKDLGCTCP